MTRIRLWPEDAGPEDTIEFIVPEERAKEMGPCSGVSFEGKEYAFSSISQGRFNFIERTGGNFELQPEWRV